MTRYIDLLWNFSSLYNYLLKLLFIGASVAIVYFLRFGAPQKATYNAEEDSFPVQYLLAPCAVLGVIINQDHLSMFEMVWAVSIYLEAVAILPQLFLLQKQGEVSCSACCAHGCSGCQLRGRINTPPYPDRRAISAPAHRWRTSPRTTSSRWVPTGVSTCSTGYTATSPRTTTSRESSGSLGLCRWALKGLIRVNPPSTVGVPTTKLFQRK